MTDLRPKHGEGGGGDVFADTGHLLEASRPAVGFTRAMVLLPPLGLLTLVLAVVLLALSGGAAAWVGVLAVLLLLVSVAVTVAIARLTRRAREERREVDEIQELVLLRHWTQAAERVTRLLSRPMRLPSARLGAILQLAQVLIRYGHYEEAIEVADAILKDRSTDPGTRFSVGCGRAMALLRAGRLFDAGEAISRLRREVSRTENALRRAREAREAGETGDDEATQPSEDEDDAGLSPLDRVLSEGEGGGAGVTPGGGPPLDSAVLVLVELYRDVQTRHSEEAVATFRTKGQILRERLGVRYGDVLALVAVAEQRLGNAAAARQRWQEATTLVQEVELLRRYPEVAEVAECYEAARRPDEHPAGPVPRAGRAGEGEGDIPSRSSEGEGRAGPDAGPQGEGRPA